MNLLPPISNKRIFGLDFLRAVAILWVVYDHSTSYINHKYQFWFYLPLNFFDGVTVFFVLSGYLIGKLFLTQYYADDFSFKKIIIFCTRRWLRTLPTFYVVYVLFFLYLLVSGKNLNQFSYKVIFFVQNFLSSPPNWFSEAWSLSVEEWFYILFPMLTFAASFFLKRKKIALLITLLLFIMLPLLLRWYFFISDNFQTFRFLDFRNAVFFRLDSIMFGVLAAMIQHQFNSFFINKKNILLVVGVALFIFHFVAVTFAIKMNLYFAVLLFTIEPFAIFLCIPFFANWKLDFTKYFFSKLITLISLISYSAYLLNKTIIQDIIITKFLEKTELDKVSWVYLTIPVYFAYWVIVAMLSVGLYLLIEQPTLQWRDKNFRQNNY